MGRSYQDIKCSISIKLTLSRSLIVCNCSEEEVVSKKLIVPYVFRRYQIGDFTLSLRLRCYDAVLTWKILELFQLYPFHRFSSTATSSATRDYGTVPEWTGRKEERNRNTPSSSRVFNSKGVQKADMYFYTFKQEILNFH